MLFQLIVSETFLIVWVLKLINLNKNKLNLNIN